MQHGQVMDGVGEGEDRNPFGATTEWQEEPPMPPAQAPAVVRVFRVARGYQIPREEKIMAVVHTFPFAIQRSDRVTEIDCSNSQARESG